MMKSLALLPRRPDLARAQFRDYYETRHAPLALRHFPFAKYVRNHLLDHDGIGFDTISEFWSNDLAGLAALMGGEIGVIMREDERRFMDQPAIRSAGAEETLLAGTPRTVEDRRRRKEALLLRCPNGVAPSAFAAAAADWGRALAADAGATLERVTLDVVVPWEGAPWPFDAVLWLWTAGTAPARARQVGPGVALWEAVAVEACESAARGG